MPRWGSTEISPGVAAILAQVRPQHEAVADHPLYRSLRSVPQVRCFMEHHVFAVWDFMSLLTSLRTHLTCTQVPWRPVGSPDVRRFVNELLLAEESDERFVGPGHASHFELYREAMIAVGADTGPIDALLEGIDVGSSVPAAVERAGAPPAAAAFVGSTWQVIESGSLPRLLGAFTFGRESLIPSMFTGVRTLAVSDPTLRPFVDYLDRHIELDGDEHAPIAFGLVEATCGDDRTAWMDVADGAASALAARRRLWDAVEAQARPLESDEAGVL